MPEALLSYDDVGDPAGLPVVYLHGTPDSRLARHPDDGLAAAAGVRLLAVDRPGYGGSPLVADVGVAIGSVLDAAGVRSATLLAWSGGALDALKATAALPERIGALHLVAAIVPFQAFADADVSGAGEGWLGLFDMVEAFGPDKTAPMLTPYPCDRELALEHQRERRDPAEQARLAAVPGGVVRMADALVESVREGLDGVGADLAAQTTPVDLSGITTHTTLWYGDEDPVAPPPFARWYADALPDTTLVVAPNAGHFMPFTHWRLILERLRPGLP